MGGEYVPWADGIYKCDSCGAESYQSGPCPCPRGAGSRQLSLLVVGYGSIGKRHAGILRGMGHDVKALDTYPDSGADFSKMADLDPRCYDGILICTPSNLRQDIVEGLYWEEIAAPRAWFVEKPVGDLSSTIFTSGSALKDYVPVMVGFCYYFNTDLRSMVKALEDDAVYAVNIQAGQYLPEWHEGDYRHRYHGTPGQGGVVLDSLPHSLFIARWILGELDLVGVATGRLSHLDIRTEDMAAVLLKSKTGRPVTIQVDYLSRPRRSTVQIVAGHHSRTWEFDPAQAEEMYWLQMAVFCQVVEGKRQYGYPTLEDGIAVQKLLDGVKAAGSKQ